MVSSWRVQQAAREIRAGAVIAYPTEAVWGLGCDPWDEEAVYRLLAIKERSVDKGLILVADNIRQFDFLFEDFPEDWIDRMASTWPGPNTWLVPHQDLLPEWITGIHDSVALLIGSPQALGSILANVPPKLLWPPLMTGNWRSSSQPSWWCHPAGKVTSPICCHWVYSCS